MGLGQEAEEALALAVERYPNNPDAWHNYSVVCSERGKHQKAMEAAEKATALRPSNLESVKQMGRCALHMRKADRVEEIYQRVLQSEPTCAEAFNGLGGAALIRNQPTIALKNFEQALKLKPDLAAALANQALALKYVGRFSEAEASLMAAKELDKANPEHTWNLSLTQLAMGKFQQGFENYEIRYDQRRVAIDRVQMPGTAVAMLRPEESASGLTVAVLHEQGLGDMLQFVRLTRQLRAEGARIIVLCPKVLMAPISTVPWVDSVTHNLSLKLNIDRWVFVTSLARRYIRQESDIPRDVPYIRATQDSANRWRCLITSAERTLKVGLVWAGRPTHSNDSNRSVRLEDFAYLSRIAGVDLYSIQKGDREVDLQQVAFPITDLSSHINDFGDTAAALHNLDLLITIDSSPAHLAGAMNKPVMVLIPKVFDFRWLMDREDSPWYPSMTLVRQAQIGDWSSVHSQIEAAVRKQVSERLGTLHLKDEDDLLLEPLDLNTPVVEAGTNAQLSRAVALHQQGNTERAEALYRWVISNAPKNIDAWRNLGVLLRRSKRWDESEAAYQRALQLGPADSITLTNYANLLVDQHREQEALAVLTKSLEVRPDQTAALYLLALSLENLGRSAEALPAIEKAYAADPAKHDHRVLYAITLTRVGRLQEARPILDECLRREPNRSELILTLAQHHQAQNQFEEAQACYERALALEGQNKTMAYMNWGGVCIQLGDFARAETLTHLALQADPKNSDAWFNLALIHLTHGQFESGWEHYERRMDESRRAKDRIQKPQLSQPYWSGEPLEGKTILIYPEQGHGDTLQFIRYISDLKRLGATVWVAARAAHVRLMRAQPLIDRVIADGETASGYHYWVMPLSLPHRFHTRLATIPATVPYLNVPSQLTAEWASRVGPRTTKPRIGFVWSGSPSHGNDHNRSIPLGRWTQLLSHPGVEWVSMNFRVSEEERTVLQSLQIQDWGTQCQDFADLGAALQQIDLLISVDSAPAHMAGAIGLPVWTLLPYSPDFRWMLNRQDSPWYPTMRLFRQPQRKDWDAVLMNARRALEVAPPQRFEVQPLGNWKAPILAICTPLEFRGSLWRWMLAVSPWLKQHGVRWRLAEELTGDRSPHAPPNQAEDQLMAEWLSIAPQFKQVWGRGRPVKLDGAIGWVVLDVNARPLSEPRVVTQTTCAFLESVRSESRADLLQELKAYRCVFTPDNAFAEWCRSNGMDQVVAIPELGEATKHPLAAKRAVEQMARALVVR